MTKINRRTSGITQSAILEMLRQAGAEGLTAPELGAACGRTPQAIHSAAQMLIDVHGLVRVAKHGIRWIRYFDASAATQAEADQRCAAWKAQAMADADARDLQRRRDLTAAERAKREGDTEAMQRFLNADADRKAKAKAEQAGKVKRLSAHLAESIANNALAAKIKREGAAPTTATAGTQAGGKFEKDAAVTYTPQTRITVAPRPVGRYELLQPREGGLRSLPLGKYLEQPSTWVKATTGAEPCAA